MGADPDTFTPLDYGFYRDKDSVFSNEITLPKLNPNEVNIINHRIIHDSNILFYDDVLLDINVDKLEILTEHILKDDVNVFCNGQRIVNADANSYTLCSVFFQKDKNSIYHNNIRLDLAASETIIKEEAYAIDSNKAYFIDEEMIGVDITSFEILEDNISKDKNYVYFREEMIDKADPSSFKIMGYSQFMDKSHIFQMQQGKVCICE